MAVRYRAWKARWVGYQGGADTWHGAAPDRLAGERFTGPPFPGRAAGTCGPVQKWHGPLRRKSNTHFQGAAFMCRITLRCRLMFASAIVVGSFGPGPSFAQNTDAGAGLRFRVSFPREQSATPLDGRVLLMLSTNDGEEPRFQITSDPDTQLVFGIDVDGLKPGDPAVIDQSVLGYPTKSLADVPAGWYRVQALLHKYETFHLKNGHTVKLPMDRGEGQQWNRAPGNLYSLPRKVWIDPRSNAVTAISLDQVIPPIESVKDTKYVKHIKIQSKR